MRKRFEVQLALGKTPIEKVVLPLKSRDELPPILAGLQWIFQTPEVNSRIFVLLESKLTAGKKATGRPGENVFQIVWCFEHPSTSLYISVYAEDNGRVRACENCPGLKGRVK